MWTPPNDATYYLTLSNDQQFVVDLNCEDDWGNIQDCNPEDCVHWEDSIGWGNDADGHIKIDQVYNPRTRKYIKNIKKWYNTIVAKWVEVYSG